VVALRQLARWYYANDRTTIRGMSDDHQQLWWLLDATPHMANEDAAMEAEMDHARRGGDLAHECRVVKASSDAVRLWRLLTDQERCEDGLAVDADGKTV
jgi:hypothetical protein